MDLIKVTGAVASALTKLENDPDPDFQSYILADTDPDLKTLAEDAWEYALVWAPEDECKVKLLWFIKRAGFDIGVWTIEEAKANPGVIAQTLINHATPELKK